MKKKLRLTSTMCVYVCAYLFLAEGDNSGCIEILATLFSIILMVVTMPFSLFFCFKVVSEYERAVIFRMGRLRYVHTN